jgi:Tol biopolymer transport system component
MLRNEGLRRVKTIVAAAALLAALFATLVMWEARPAEAAFPGSNGNIAFTSSRDSNNYEIYSMAPIPSSTQTNLTNMNPTTNSGAIDFQASVSPDGKKIAFATSRNGNNEIYVMDANGSNPTRLTNNAADDGGPAFGPNGKIAFHSNREGGSNAEIYVMDATDSDTDGNGDNLKRLTTNPAVDTRPAFSPNGTRIAFETNRDDNLNIYSMKPVDTNNDGNGDELKRLTKHVASDRLPSFSPSGGKIAFTSARAGNDEVFVMKARPEGRKNRPRNLTNNAAADSDPAFSPDGTRIAFVSDRDLGPGKQEIYRMNADGTSQTRLTTNTAADFEPDWGVITP